MTREKQIAELRQFFAVHRRIFIQLGLSEEAEELIRSHLKEALSIINSQAKEIEELKAKLDIATEAKSNYNCK